MVKFAGQKSKGNLIRRWSTYADEWLYIGIFLVIGMIVPIVPLGLFPAGGTPQTEPN